MKRYLAILSFGMLAALSEASDDYPPARWVPAHSGNLTTATRPTSHPILYVIIHSTQGSYNGAISWFQNPQSRVSAHYVIRSSDGEVTQMVREKDIGWHAGNWTINTQSIGIEHEAIMQDPSWYTTAMYRSSADLTRYATRKYGIPRDRSRIRGHGEVSNTPCPGQYWNWDYYMDILRLDSRYQNAVVPRVMRPGESVTVALMMENSGDNAWSGQGDQPIRLGTQNPANRSSLFYQAGRWLTPNRPAAISYPVNASQTGLFQFMMTAPRNYGTYQESFQMVKEGVSWFGPQLTFQIQVVPWDLVIDNRSGYFLAAGDWQTSDAQADRYGADYRWIAASPTQKGYARWYLNAPIEGYYDVYAWWSAGSNRSPQVQYDMEHASGVTRFTLSQQSNGGRWNLLGRFYLTRGGGFVYVRGSGNANSVVTADAVRIAGPF
ncbi:MAG: N-acetylmuramoyl-L-alanine amidase [Fimbriimonadia bacterium]|nr:N-acetylmuramoyl-L-alanine amidase [Fimbriimonadia bacterium]